MNIVKKIKKSKKFCKKNHIPNKETIKAIKDCKNKIGLRRAKNLEDLFEQLGI